MNNTHKTSTNNVEEFVKDYINAWSTTDAGARKALVAKVYADDVDFYANEPGDGPVEHHGVAEITANIARVNARLVQGKGLITESTGFSVNHDALKVSWQMMTPDRKVAMTGMNLLLRNASGKISRDYIFIG
jgi:hypothetical protein